MKIKGVNPIEKHIEKIVFLAVSVIFLGVVAMQFLVSPNQIEVGQGKLANPGDEIYTQLEIKAATLQGQINDMDPSLPDVQRANLLDAYEEGVGSPTSVAPTLAAWLERPSGLEELGGGSDELLLATGAIRPLEVPAPTSTLAAAQWNTLDPFADDRWAGVNTSGSGDAPADFVGVTIEGAFPGQELLAALTEVEEGQRPIPRKLWQRGGLAILGVEVERQRLSESSGWADAQAVTTVGPNAMAELSTDPDPEVVMTLVRTVADNPGTVINPAYPPTISGDAWVPPTEALVRAERWSNQAEADRIRAAIARLEEEIGGGATRTRPPSGRTGGRDPAGGRNPSTTTRPATRPTRPANTDRQDEAKRRQIERFQEQLVELGFDVDEDDQRTGRTSGTSSTGAGTAGLLSDEPLPVWAHDLNVEPGATYRYRLRVAVNNPLYGREALLDPDDASQQELARESIVRGAWSEWTEPVEVPDRTYLFVKGVSAADGLDADTRVTGEVFEMYYGYYRRSAFTLELGDTVRSTASLPDTLVFLDPAKMEAAGADRVLSDLARWAQDKADRPEDPPAKVELPEGATRAPKSIPLAYDAALVDVAESMTRSRESGLGQGDRAEIEAVFREQAGSLMIRRVGEDTGPSYALVHASARRGETGALARVVGESPAAPAWPGGRQPTVDPRDDFRVNPGSGRRPSDPRDGP